MSYSMEEQYLDFMQALLDNGTKKSDRTGTGTLSIFGHQMRCDLREGFPLLTTKKVHLKSVIVELLWFLKGSTNIAYLKENGVKIWDEWANAQGELGPVYGKQWRSWSVLNDVLNIPQSDLDRLVVNGWEDHGQFETRGGDQAHLVGKEIDQIAVLIDQLKNSPDSRRLIVSAWNVGDLDEMALMPCHTLFQFCTEEIPLSERALLAPVEVLEEWRSEANYVHESDLEDLDKRYAAKLDALGVPARYLSCQLYQRSADWMLGVPFNIASYALLTMMIAKVVNMVPKDFVHTFGDAHLYTNHLDQAKEQLSRMPRDVPVMRIADRGQTIDDFLLEDFTIEGYDPHPAIRAKVAV